jgi:hypothetical protein
MPISTRKLKYLGFQVVFIQYVKSEMPMVVFQWHKIIRENSHRHKIVLVINKYSLYICLVEVQEKTHFLFPCFAEEIPIRGLTKNINCYQSVT